jgi:hypothetical protein
MIKVKILKTLVQFQVEGPSHSKVCTRTTESENAELQDTGELLGRKKMENEFSVSLTPNYALVAVQKTTCIEKGDEMLS